VAEAERLEQERKPSLKEPGKRNLSIFAFETSAEHHRSLPAGLRIHRINR